MNEAAKGGGVSLKSQNSGGGGYFGNFRSQGGILAIPPPLAIPDLESIKMR